MKKITIKIKTQNKTEIVFSSKKKILLKILEKNNILIQYNCRNGFCGCCKIKLISGKITYCKNKQPIAYCNFQEILPCSCFVVEDITIKI
ncbi:MAG: class I ribonucleotide reductase maintenance protein YfaE [Buchnera aphidicola (Tetraneura akinire)]